MCDNKPQPNQTINNPETQNPNIKNLSIQISHSLYNKLLDLTKKEGLRSVEDLVIEILSQGVMLKAWEILEKKFSEQKNQSLQHNQSYNKGSKKNFSRNQYFNIMDDKAAFLEYVRSLDKKRK